ncbi:MAG: hypothetical protein PCFJNLEI_03104 [Verrucomicrobiae bacterium]|nr:hypothetical protein [Verrucomicrobiae bacterium]
MSKKALINWGGWNGHEPDKCAEIFRAVLANEGFEVRVVNDLNVYTETEYMESLSVIVPIWTMSEIKNEQLKGLMDAVTSGVGLAGWHGGMCDSFRIQTGYQFMTGGQWVAHPDGIVDYTVNITKRNDPIVKGIADFKMHSEQYYLHTDPGNDVLATTTFGDNKEAPWVKGTVMPVVWKRQWAKGRVFYSALGHVAKDFEVPEAKEIQRRGILWAAR